MDRISPAGLNRLGAVVARAQGCMDVYNRGIEHHNDPSVGPEAATRLREL